jgi:stearoyl-CoA desaturase (delta-9 desaturase)
MAHWQIFTIVVILEFHFMWVAWSVYMHRGLCHGHFTFTPVMEHFFRFWLWFTKGGIWYNWKQHYVAIHRKHHHLSDTDKDLHSPFRFTFKQLYTDIGRKPEEANYITPEEIQYYAPDISSKFDWIETNLYVRYPKLGKLLLWITYTLIFGWLGFTWGMIRYVWGKQISTWWGHYIIHKAGFTYAGNRGADRSKIIFPIGFIMAGEELHANHHNDPRAYNQRRWFEIDTGWYWCKLFMWLKLIKSTHPIS